MKGRITAYLVLLACGFGVLAFTSGGVNWARDKLAYAGLIAQRGNEDDPSRAAAILRYDRSDHLVPAGATTVPITVVVFGDDQGEPDEILELQVTGIDGPAWSPGPGSIRIVTDEPREADEGRCTGSTEWPSVRMCQ